MQLYFVTLMLIGCALAAQLPDSATQGPNPQDIATPEPEYIDIDGPLPDAFNLPPAPAPAPVAFPAAPAQTRSFNTFSRAPAAAPLPFAPKLQAQPQPQYQLPGHTFNSQTGYSYRRPVYYRRVYRRFY